MEQGLNLETEEYDPKKSKVTLKISSALEGESQWQPSREKAMYWDTEKKMFIRVSTSISIHSEIARIIIIVIYQIVGYAQKRTTRQSYISKSFRPSVVHDVYQQNLITPVKHAHYKCQALLLSHLIGQAGTCVDKMCPS